MKPKRTAKQLDTLFTTRVVGNHCSDGDLWLALDEIVADERYSIEDRAKASRKVDEVIGESLGDLGDAERVAKHVAILKEG